MAEFRESVQHAIDDGFTFLLFLTAVDELGRDGGFRVVAMLERPSDGERRECSHSTSRDEPTAPRIDDLLPGAGWLQRQVHDMFGITFDGADNAPLIHHGEGHPLRKEFLLPERGETSWPGALEPGSASPSRRSLLPVGVPDPAVAENPAATAEDVALSATGTRVRVRR
ncbi:NADH-quinone oxidoreductase subunit C [uncultured Tessaracoccus sp.]|uniref:NADH-quinone oxidoreductase subunit C n=1 Tax=uncultured Tessaracoccus sp. TaxID=905023 RepID=UPI002607A70D|nr:NADH-quinone oxidoreductase subunit C [uncultured Tessaracoccus sp.]